MAVMGITTTAVGAATAAATLRTVSPTVPLTIWETAARAPPSRASKCKPHSCQSSIEPMINVLPFPDRRKQRLNSVRASFIQAYGKTIGLKFKEGSSMNLASFIGNLADQLF